jgi:hypothetical protein
VGIPSLTKKRLRLSVLDFLQAEVVVGISSLTKKRLRRIARAFGHNHTVDKRESLR